MLLLLYVTSMPTAPILVDRISAPAKQDTTAMEKLAEVGETIKANLKVSYFTVTTSITEVS